MPRRLSSLPRELTIDAFTTGQARALSVSDWRLTHRSLHAPYRGIRVSVPAIDIVDRCRELLPLLPSTAVFSHVTALDLHQVDRPWGLHRADDLHIQVPEEMGRPRLRGVASHRRSAVTVPTQSILGIPVTPIELVWVQLAAELTVCELVVAGDAMLRRTSARTNLDRLGRAVAGLPPGTRGVQRLRTALAQLRPRTDSCMETRLRWMIVDAGLPEPVVNPVLRPRSDLLVMPDLAYPAARLAIEYDGDVHRTDRVTWRRDIARRQALEAIGWRTITCTGDDIRQPDRALAWIRRALLARSTPTSHPPQQQHSPPTGQ